MGHVALPARFPVHIAHFRHCSMGFDLLSGGILKSAAHKLTR